MIYCQKILPVKKLTVSLDFVKKKIVKFIYIYTYEKWHQVIILYNFLVWKKNGRNYFIPYVQRWERRKKWWNFLHWGNNFQIYYRGKKKNMWERGKVKEEKTRHYSGSNCLTFRARCIPTIFQRLTQLWQGAIYVPTYSGVPSCNHGKRLATSWSPTQFRGIRTGWVCVEDPHTMRNWHFWTRNNRTVWNWCLFVMLARDAVHSNVGRHALSV